MPALHLAAWRLQLTSVLLLLGALYQWFRTMVCVRVCACVCVRACACVCTRVCVRVCVLQLCPFTPMVCNGALGARIISANLQYRLQPLPISTHTHSTPVPPRPHSHHPPLPRATPPPLHTHTQDANERRATLANWHLLLASGVCLAIHFGAWVWGLQHTTLTHSLLFVCCVPVLIAGGMWLLRRPISRVGDVMCDVYMCVQLG